MYVVCEQHLEIAIDDFVDEYEDAPDIIDLRITTFDEWKPPAHCERCESGEARFLVL
jgi:CxxH/CxxC protein (TIGR04129 family)